MKIVSKRRRNTAPSPKRDVASPGVIIVDGMMTPEEIKRAEDALEEIKRQLDDLQEVIDNGWYNLREDA